MNKEALNRAIKCLRPQGVFLAKSDFNIRGDIVPPTVGEADWTSQHAVKHAEDFFTAEAVDSHGKTIKLVGYRLLYATRQLRKDDIENAPAEIGTDDNRILSSLIAFYTVMYERTTEIDDEALREFGRCNAAYHVTPFWRAHVQELYGKAGMPLPIVPFLKLPSTEEKCDDK